MGKLSNEQIPNMDFFTRCSYLNLHPVLLARRFQYRVEQIFRIIVLDGPMHKVKYQAIRIEFQVRGSPHVYLFSWVYGVPVLNPDNIPEYILFVDSILRLLKLLTNTETSPDLFDLVVTLLFFIQKYKNQTCRYHFDKFVTEKTIVTCPLPSTMSEDSKKRVLEKRKQTL